MFDPSAYDALSRSSNPAAAPKPDASFAPPQPQPFQPPAPSQPFGQASGGPKPMNSWGDAFSGWAGAPMSAKREDPLAFRLLRYAMQPSPSSAGFGGSPANASGGPGGATPPVAPAPTAGTQPPAQGGIFDMLRGQGGPAAGAPSPQPLDHGQDGGVSPGQYFTTPKGLGGGQEAGGSPTGPSNPLGGLLASLLKGGGQPQPNMPMQLPGAAPAAGGAGGQGFMGMLGKLFGGI